MSDLRPIRLGFVSLGQGPRPDLEALHQRIFRALGFDLEAVWAHVLDGLDDAACAPLLARDDDPAIRALHGPAGENGLPARNSWFCRAALTARLPAVIRLLEDRGVTAIIICAAEMLPELRLRARVPVVLPAEAMVAQAMMLAHTRPEAQLGFIVYGDRRACPACARSGVRLGLWRGHGGRCGRAHFARAGRSCRPGGAGRCACRGAISCCGACNMTAFMQIAAQYAAGLAQALTLLVASGTLAFVFGLIVLVLDLDGPRRLRPILRAASWLLQTMPPLILLFMAFYGSTALGWNVSPIAAAIAAFTLFSTAYYYEIFRAGYQGVPSGQIEAGLALGVPRWRMFLHVLAPQMLRIASGPLIGRTTVLFKETSLASAISASEIMSVATGRIYAGDSPTTQVLIAGAIYATINIALILLERRVAAGVLSR